MAKKAPTKNLGLLALGHLAWATACALALVIAFHARRETMAVRLRSEALGLAWAIRVEEAAHLELSGKPVSTPWFQKTLRSFLTARLRALGSREARLMFRPEAGPPIELEATSAAEPLPSHFGLRLGRAIARYIPPPAGSVIVSGEVWNYPKEASAMLSPLVPRPSQGRITIRLTLSESLWARWLFREAHFFGLMGLGGLALVWLWFAARKVPRGRNGADSGRGRAARNALLTFLSGLWAASLVAWDLDALQMQRRARLFHKLAGERAAAGYSEFLRILNVGELLRGFFLGSEEVLPEEFRAFVACGKGSGFLGLPEIRLAAWGESGGEGGSGAFQLRASVCASPRLREIFSARLESESAKAAVESLRRMEVIASKPIPASISEGLVEHICLVAFPVRPPAFGEEKTGGRAWGNASLILGVSLEQWFNLGTPDPSDFTREALTLLQTEGLPQPLTPIQQREIAPPSGRAAAGSGDDGAEDLECAFLIFNPPLMLRVRPGPGLAGTYPLTALPRTLGAGFLVSLLAAALARAQTARSERLEAAVAARTAELQTQSEELRTVLRSIGDAVIVADTRGRVVLMNKEAERLTGWEEEEASGRPLEEVFRIINEQTRKPAPNPLTRVISEGAVCGLANHTVLVARDGAERPIADSAAPVRDPEGKLWGAVLVFRDQTGEREMRRRLQEERDRAVAYFETVDLIMAVIDLQGRILDLNRPGAAALGWDREDALGKNWFHFFVPEKNRALFLESFRQVLAGNSQMIHYRSEVLRRDGSQRTIHWRNSFLYDASGKPYAILSAGLDVTDRMEAEEKFRAFAELSPVALLFYRGDYILYGNPALCRITGYTLEELRNMQVWDLVREDYRSLVRERGYRRVRGEKVPARYEIPIVTKQGQERWVDYSATLITLGGELTGMGAALDITEQKLAKEALEKSEQFLKDMFEAIQDGISVLDRDLNVISVNRWMEKMYASQMPLVGKKCYEAYHRRNSPCPWCPTLPTFETGEPHTNEVPYAIGGGPPGWLELSAFPLKDEQGRVRQVIEYVKDITERKRAEEKLRRALEAAREANRARDRFLRNMSHELRTPLSGVVGTAELLEETPLNKEQRRFCGLIRASGESMLTVIDEILDFTRLETGKLRLASTEFSPERLLQETLGMLALRAQDKGLELIGWSDLRLPRSLRGDPARLRQILLNLAGNAIKFTERGEVVVWLSVDAESEDSAVLRFTVGDSGPGMEEEELRGIFRPFGQGRAGRSGANEGLGLGLAITNRLVRLMGGRLRVASEPSKGTVFWFSIKLKKTGEAPPPPFEALAGKRFLACSRNTVLRTWLQDALSRVGAVCLTAADCEEAARRLQDKPPLPDAILLDVQGMEKEKVQELRRRAERAGLPARAWLAVCPWTWSGSLSDLQRMGFALSLLKPVTETELCAAAARLFRPEAASEPARTGGSRPSPGAGEAVHILLTEDDPINREAIVAMLKRLGHLVETAANGREALEILRRKRFALIFMDCRMPEMDGWETTRRIRSGEAGPEAARAPIVALTAHALKEDRRHCVEAGMDDYLSKPPRMDRLKAMIEKWSGKESGAVGAVAEESSRADRVPEEAAAGGEALPVFNLRALLDRVDGDEDLARTMMEAFFEEAPGQLAELREHLASGGIEDAARMAHSIKGSAGFISGEEVYALAQEMDRLGKAGDLEGMRGKLPEFEKAMKRLLEALRRELGKRAQGEAESPDDGSAAR